MSASSIRLTADGTARMGQTAHAAAVELADLDGPAAEAARAYVTLIRPHVPRETGRLAASVQSHGSIVRADTRYAAAVNARKPFLIPLPPGLELVDPFRVHLSDALGNVKGA